MIVGLLRMAGLRLLEQQAEVQMMLTYRTPQLSKLCVLVSRVQQILIRCALVNAPRWLLMLT